MKAVLALVLLVVVATPAAAQAPATVREQRIRAQCLRAEPYQEIRARLHDGSKVSGILTGVGDRFFVVAERGTERPLLYAQTREVELGPGKRFKALATLGVLGLLVLVASH